MIIYLARHGQTDYNKARKLQGQEVDGPLNDEGVKQAYDLLAQLPPDFQMVLTSPLKRAYMTAEIIAAHSGKPLVVRSELNEKSFGSLSGKTWEEIEAMTGKDFKTADREQAWDYRAYGGESVEDLTKRLTVFLEELKQQSVRQGTAAIFGVTHGGVLRLLYKILKGEEMWDVENATIHKFEI